MLKAVDAYVYVLERDEDGVWHTISASPNRESFTGGGAADGDAVAREWLDLIHPDDRDDSSARPRRSTKGTQFEASYRLVGYDGVERWVLDRNVLYDTGDGRNVRLGLVLDVSDRRQLERRLQSSVDQLRGANVELRQLRMQAEQQARTDVVTGAHNRLALSEHVALALESGQRGRARALRPRPLQADQRRARPRRRRPRAGRGRAPPARRREPRRLRRALGRRGVRGARPRGRRRGRARAPRRRAAARDRQHADRGRRRAADGRGLRRRDAADARARASMRSSSTPTARSTPPSAAVATACCWRATITESDLIAERPEAIRIAEALAVAVGVREGAPADHPAYVASLSARIARCLQLDSRTALRCELGGWLHDIGKLSVPERVLLKPTMLDDEEWAIMREHAELGEQIVERIPALHPAGPAIRHHHEHFDGRGYPDGLAGFAIPIEARIVAVADTFSAMTQARPYASARSTEEALTSSAAAPDRSSTRRSSPRCRRCSPRPTPTRSRARPEPTSRGVDQGPEPGPRTRVWHATTGPGTRPPGLASCGGCAVRRRRHAADLPGAESRQ